MQIIYVGSKNYRWIWFAVDRNGRRFLGCEVGSRDTETGEKLWQSVGKLASGKVMTDYWQPYEAFIPKSQHVQSKAETYTVEGYNLMIYSAFS